MFKLTRLLKMKLLKNLPLMAFILTKTIIDINSHIVRFETKVYADFSISLNGLADPGSVLKSFTLKTKRQCVLECVSLATCKSLNYKQDGGNCELLERSFTEGVASLVARTGWVYMSTNDEETDIGPTCKLLSPCKNGGICKETSTAPGFNCICDNLHSGQYCQNDRGFASCKAVFDAGFRTNGVYRLTGGMGYHTCRLTTLGDCGSGGWTLILKTDGNLRTFDYSANYWTSSNVYNQIYTLKDGMDDGQEAKYEAFNKLAFTKVCIGMRHGAINFAVIPRAESSMLSLCQSGTYKIKYIATSLGRAKWLGLVSGSDLQPHCNREGFNNQGAHGKYVQIGIFGNNEGDCNTIYSVMGIGIGGSNHGESNIKTGVHSPYTSVKRIKAKGYILVQ